MLAARDLAPADLIAGTKETAIGLVLSDLRLHARRRLTEARDKPWLVPKPALAAFLPASLCDLYLNRLDKLGAAAIKTVAEVSQWRKQVRLYWQARMESF
jgi:phytoene synthase